MLVCEICGKQYPADSEMILDCDICLRFVCVNCFDSKQHLSLDLQEEEGSR